jgi:head-tail adaptor
MVLNASTLNRKIQIQRRALDRWENIGNPLSARRRDVFDQERYDAGIFDNKLITRFLVRSTPFAKEIRRTDRLKHEGVAFEITGIKEADQNGRFVEITATTGGHA